MIRLAVVALVAAVLGFIYIKVSRKGNGTMKNERQITAAELSSMEEAIELSIAYDHADTKTFAALKKEYRKAKRLYRKQQRRG